MRQSGSPCGFMAHYRASAGMGGFVREQASGGGGGGGSGSGGALSWEASLPAAVQAARAPPSSPALHAVPLDPGQRARLADLFGSSGDGGGGWCGDDGGLVRDEAGDARELYLLNQDIRWARAAASASSQYVTDAQGSQQPEDGGKGGNSGPTARSRRGDGGAVFKADVRGPPACSLGT
jgi:hypothetical protein